MDTKSTDLMDFVKFYFSMMEWDERVRGIGRVAAKRYEIARVITERVFFSEINIQHINEYYFIILSICSLQMLIFNYQQPLRWQAFNKKTGESVFLEKEFLKFNIKTLYHCATISNPVEQVGTHQPSSRYKGGCSSEQGSGLNIRT